MPDPEAVAMEAMLRAGVMPSDVEDALDRANRAGEAMPLEAEDAQAAVVTERDQERALQWWFFSPAVPQRFKRLLTAREAKE